jgi:hypothetical protein
MRTHLTTINHAVSGAREARSELAGAASARGRRFVARSECDQ